MSKKHHATREELEQQLRDHRANRPQLPRPVPPYDSPEYRGYSLAMQQYQEQESRLEVEIAMAHPDYPLTRTGNLKKKHSFAEKG